ncbi:MAG TPA: glycosyltransferase family 4 protein, partial [Bryobacteraceae bacterium]|nr:glycosyltransferase family 4 protein [Bryobacteraceae bacterium]
MNAPRRFAVLQSGARMHYAVPALLSSAGMLDALYTDIHAGCWPARSLDATWPATRRPRAQRRLLGRRLPAEISPEQVFSVPLRAILEVLRRSHADPGIARRVLDRHFGSADALYAMAPGDLPAMRAARERGMFVAFEQVVGPTFPRYLLEESARFPGFEAWPSRAQERDYVAMHRELWACADVVLAPSEFVAQGIVELGGPAEKIRLVPYGIPESLMDLEPAPVPGRVLFVGRVGLRKGSHYLAEAARILKERHVACEIRVVGEVPAAMARHPLFQGPVYAGQVPRGEVQREFLAADIFVLPSLAEGSATAHLEALACGLPVIATPNSGAVIRHEQEGLLVPVRDAAALAGAIERLVADRALRGRLSEAARRRAASYTWPCYRDRLLAVLATEHSCPHVPPFPSRDRKGAVVLFRHLGPYHIARCEAVRHLCDLTVMELAAKEQSCGWDGDRPAAEVRILTLSPSELRAKPRFAAAARVWKALGRVDPRTVFLAGYGELPFLG